MIWSWMPWCSVSCMPWLGKCFARVSVEDGSSSSSQYNCTFLFFLNSHFTLKETFGLVLVFFFQEASVTLTCLTNGSACDSPLDIQGSCVPSGATCCPHKSVSVCLSSVCAAVNQWLVGLTFCATIILSGAGREWRGISRWQATRCYSQVPFTF